MPNIGRLRERLTVQRNDPPVLSVSSLTRTNSTATVTTTAPHGYLATDYATITGCDGATTGYNVKVKLVTVPTPTTFTFTCSSALPTPATGTISVVYTSNAVGGHGANGSAWRTLDTIAAEAIPLKAWERLQLAAVRSDTTYRFRIRARADLAGTMRLLWVPSWPQGMPRQTLEINGILRDPESVAYQFLEAAQVPA